MKRIKVYIPFALNEIKRQLAYKWVFYMLILIDTYGAFISYFLWMAIYNSSASASLGGLTRNEMIVYIFISYITTCLISNSIGDQVSSDVSQGTVAMNLIKPIDYRLSLIARASGTMIFNLFVPGIIIWIGLEVYKVQVLGMSMTSGFNILTYLLSCILSFLIMGLFDYCFSMIAFFTTYIFGLQLVKGALLNFLTGQLIPLSFFPEVVQRVFDCLPFSSMVYTPVMIYLGKYQGAEMMGVLVKQIIWVILLYALGSLIWRKVTKRLIVLGG